LSAKFWVSCWVWRIARACKARPLLPPPPLPPPLLPLPPLPLPLLPPPPLPLLLLLLLPPPPPPPLLLLLLLLRWAGFDLTPKKAAIWQKLREKHDFTHHPEKSVFGFLGYRSLCFKIMDPFPLLWNPGSLVRGIAVECAVAGNMPIRVLDFTPFTLK
jgi:hypothetical protein